MVGDRGYRLSGGERQRLAIARMLLKAPDVVILDEATAHLDSGSEAAVQAALDEALSGRTSIVIAHRLSTVRQADAIVVLDHGRVVDQGTHAELLARGGVYAELYRTQFASTDGASPLPSPHDRTHRRGGRRLRGPGGARALLGRRAGRHPAGRDDDWHYVDPPGWTRLAFQRVPEGKAVKNRRAPRRRGRRHRGGHRAGRGAGRDRVGEVHVDTAGSFQVLLDPEGNEWCVVRPA